MSDLHLTLHVAKPSDASDMINFFNTKTTGEESARRNFGNTLYTVSVEEEEEDLRRLAEERTGTRLLARNGETGELVGMGMASRKDGNRSAHVFYLGVVVWEEVWRKGIGKAIMEGLEEAAARLGAEKVALEVNADNKAAKLLYQSLGFEVEATLKNSLKIGERYVDLIVMGKQLC